MNEKLMAEIVKILEYLRVSVEQGGEFVKEQAPLVVQEAIAYGRAYETGLMVLGLIGFLIGLVAVLRRDKIEWLDDGSSLVGILRLFAGLVGTVVILANWPDFMMAWFAPRIYLLKWVSELIRTAAGGQP